MISEGSRRLSILLGALGVLGWAITVFFMLGYADDRSLTLYDWGIIVGIALACFFIPFVIVRGIAWVVSGFRQGKTK
ncbi:MAG: hypothetical protein PHO37_10075 [Kiritimatiellae bacterium]|nr:hypothetical protein [Kiritimatiellia bacterium]